MESADDEEVEYSYKYLTTLNFDSKYVMIADTGCEKIGPELLKEIEDTEGDYENNYKAMGPIRNKEHWDVYLKYRQHDTSNSSSSLEAPDLIDMNESTMELVDIILINKKLLMMLPEKNLDEKLNELSWECDGKITLDSYMLSIFDCKHFNNKESYSIPDDEDNSWYELMYTTMMEEKKDILDADHGVLFFLQNESYGVYQIVDDVDKQILAINFEVIQNNHWSAASDGEDDEKDSDKTWSILSSNYFSNRLPTTKKINNSKVKTI